MLSDLVAGLTRRLAAQNLLRETRTVEPDGDGPLVRVDGRPVVCFCSNDYLNLARTVAVAEAAWGAGASRLLAGTGPWQVRLEERMAAFRRRPAALFFTSGYLANIGLLAGLGTREVIFLSDELNHASIIDGLRLATARRAIYRHGDVDHARLLLEEHRDIPHRFIVTEAVFSMDGDVAPLAELAALPGAELIVDDAHGTGLFGPQGRGVTHHAGVTPAVEVVTLSKAFGASGGFVVGDEATIRLLKTRARPFVYSTAPPPALCAAGLAAIDRVEAADDRRRALSDNVAYLRRKLDRPGQTPIIPVVLGSAEAALEASARLWEKGYFVPAIRPPTVPEGASRLRISVTAGHTRAHLDGLLEALAAR